jgi:hypothetical protein
MNTPSKTLVVSLCLFCACLCESIAGETRDGSIEKSAIVVPVPNAQLHNWEIAYLKKHFPEHYSLSSGISSLNQEHAFIGHEKQGKFFDYYSFMIRGKKIEVYFDISKQVEEDYARSHAKPK